MTFLNFLKLFEHVLLHIRYITQWFYFSNKQIQIKNTLILNFDWKKKQCKCWCFKARTSVSLKKSISLRSILFVTNISRASFFKLWVRENKNCNMVQKRRRICCLAGSERGTAKKTKSFRVVVLHAAPKGLFFFQLGLPKCKAYDKLFQT